MSDLEQTHDTVELIMEFEKEFDVQIPDDEAEKITTVGRLLNILKTDHNINIKNESS